MQHHYQTAEYIGDKVLALTKDPNDAFWLAQVHFGNGQYSRARKLLSGAAFEGSVSCRYLAALCHTKLDQWDEALDVLGEVNPFKTDHSVKNQDGGIKLEASMCYLRGQIYAHQSNHQMAKDCYREAVLVDAKCYEAFNELINNKILTPAEEAELMEQINFDSADSNGEFIRLLYSTRLNKYTNPTQFGVADSRLRDEYNLADNADLLLSRAELLFIQCKFQKCLDVCERILALEDLNLAILPYYLSSLHELGGKNKLFIVAHRLAEEQADHFLTWLAIGTYYLSIQKMSEARRFFSKASMIHPNSGAAWIGFAHTFALEGEHEQAINAYATAARLFPGTHLPNLFLGMQYMQVNNFSLASEHLAASFGICSVDPLLLNELGVVYYHQNYMSKAEAFFLRALDQAGNLQSDSRAWISIHTNLAHVYRRTHQYEKALEYFEKVCIKAGRDGSLFSSMALVHLKMKDTMKAIDLLHTSLAISADDPIATDLLNKALEIHGRTCSQQVSDETDKIIQVSKPTAIFQKWSKSKRDNSTSMEKEMETLAGNLRRGKDSSDDDSMEIESD